MFEMLQKSKIYHKQCQWYIMILDIKVRFGFLTLEICVRGNFEVQARNNSKDNLTINEVQVKLHDKFGLYIVKLKEASDYEDIYDYEDNYDYEDIYQSL